jgi:hypothetical protein
MYRGEWKMNIKEALEKSRNDAVVYDNGSIASVKDKSLFWTTGDRVPLSMVLDNCWTPLQCNACREASSLKGSMSVHLKKYHCTCGELL